MGGRRLGQSTRSINTVYIMTYIYHAWYSALHGCPVTVELLLIILSCLQMCCVDTIHRGTLDTHGCCGSQQYDGASEVCCEGMIEPAQPGSKCCGPTPYHPNQEACCLGVVEPAERGSQCCGPTPYHPARETCCMDTVTPGAEAGRSCCGKAIVIILLYLIFRQSPAQPQTV